MASGGGHSVDCLILDVRLPGMSGLELQRHSVANGFQVPVSAATGGAEALEILREALALLDMQMPGMYGLQLARTIEAEKSSKRMTQNSGLPGITLTSSATGANSRTRSSSDARYAELPGVLKHL